MTNLTVSTDYFDPSVYWPRAEPRAMPYDRLDALRSAGALLLGFLDSDGGFVLIRECISRPTALTQQSAIKTTFLLYRGRG